MMKRKISLVLVALATFFVSCDCPDKNNNQNEQQNEVTQVENEEAAKDCSEVHWSHHAGDEGPENWKNLCEEYSACGGHSQSPIDIITNSVVNSEELLKPEFNYAQSKVNIINNGHTVQFNIDNGNSVNLNGKDYNLLQFHFHATSEHTIDGEYYPLEVHFVHKHSDTDFAVIGIMYKEGKENELLKKYLDQFPTNEGEFNSEDMIDLLDILPTNKSYYYYAGSLTTPPCSEIVSWYVLQNPLEASKEQIEKFSEILHSNLRPIQQLNEREIKSFVE